MVGWLDYGSRTCWSVFVSWVCGYSVCYAYLFHSDGLVKVPVLQL